MEPDEWVGSALRNRRAGMEHELQFLVFLLREGCTALHGRLLLDNPLYMLPIALCAKVARHDEPFAESHLACE